MSFKFFIFIPWVTVPAIFQGIGGDEGRWRGKEEGRGRGRGKMEKKEGVREEEGRRRGRENGG